MKRIIPIIIIIAAVILVCLPLFHSGFFVSDDGTWMIIRLSAFFQSFREGQFPVRFLGRLNYGYGYPVANFLYPGFLYVGSLIHIFGVSFVSTVKILLAGSVLLGTVFSYMWLRKYFKPLASTVGAVGFTLAPYLLFDIYRRGSVGEVFAFAWAAMGLYSIAAGKRWRLGLAIPLLILAHNTLAFLFLGVFVLYITVRGNWRQLWLIFASGIGMASFFWLPALYERKYVLFDNVQVADAASFFVTQANWLLLGIPSVIVAGVSLVYKKLYQKEKIFFVVLCIGTLILSLPVSGILWHWKFLEQIIQFPYRLLSVSVVCGAWLIAYAIENNKKTFRWLLIAVFAGLGVWQTTMAVTQVTYTDQPETFYTTNEATTTVADEYMPKWVSQKPTVHADRRLIFYQGRGTIRVQTMSTQTVDVVVTAAEDSILQLNTLYYPGWGATVDDTQIRIDYANMQDVMRIPVPAGTHHVVIGFRETISRFLADIAALVSFVFYIVVLIVTGKRRGKKK